MAYQPKIATQKSKNVPPSMSIGGQNTSEGLASALVAFFIWGSLPLFWRELRDIPAYEILCHRIVWSFLGLAVFLSARGLLGSVYKALQNKKVRYALCLTSVTLTSNWFLFIWAINSGLVLETSLGYYINPMLNILIGVIFFKDRTSPAIKLAIVLAIVGIVYQIFALGHVPYVALSIAISFTLYGVLRKFVVVDALPGLFIETAIATPFALAYLVWLGVHGQGAFSFSISSTALAINALLVLSGIVTTIPLTLFTYAVRRVSLTTLGLTQYISPSMTFLLGIFVFKEVFTFERFITFACIWIALAIYTTDNILFIRKEKKLFKQ